MKTETEKYLNGIDVAGLREAIDGISNDPSQGMVRFRVRSGWVSGTKSRHVVDGFELAGEKIARPFEFETDEPLELFGGNTTPNPQEYLMGALNACMMVGYVAGAALRGIRLTKLEVECDGEIDLRGFLGIDGRVKPGYDRISYTVRIAGDGSEADFREIHEAVRKTSPNFFNLSQPVALEGTLVVG